MKVIDSIIISIQYEMHISVKETALCLDLQSYLQGLYKLMAQL
jgi:hypothetical protein